MKRTQIEKKLIYQFEKFVIKDKTAKAIEEFRSTSGIPKEGLSLTTKELEHLNDPFWFPQQITFASVVTRSRWIKKLNIFTRKLLQDFFVNTPYFFQVTRTFICFNELCFDQINSEAIPFQSGVNSGCKIEDVRLMFDNYFFEDDLAQIHNSDSVELYYKNPDDSKLLAYEYVKTMDRVTGQYPVAIWLHKSIGKNDLINFIESNWKIIEHIQSSYHDKGEVLLKFSKTKSNPDVKKRNDLIISLDGLSYKEIRKRVREELGIFVGDGEIGKILSIERKKRK